MLRFIAPLTLAFLVFPVSLSPSQATVRPVVEVAFVLDTTGSMGGLIEGAKRKIWSIATAIIDANPDAEIRMGLVAYRDMGDDYVTRKFDLTTDIQDIYANLLELRARGGGDWPESVNEALHAAVDKLSWSKTGDICRIVFLVGDAPPHMDYVQDMKYPQVLALAKQKDILINAVQAGNARDTERVWREIAQLGNGRYIPIPQDGGKIVIIETPYDTEIIELQNRINGTVIPYGPKARRAQVEDKTRQVAAAPRSAASEMASYLNKSGSGRASGVFVPGAITGDGDLVADIAAGRQKLSDVKDEELPDALNKLAPAQREEAIDKAMSARKALNERMVELVKKRDQYVLDQRKAAPQKTADSFDRAVEETLRAQVKR